MGAHTNGVDFWNVGSVYLDHHYHIQIERTLLDDYGFALDGIVNGGGYVSQWNLWLHFLERIIKSSNKQTFRAVAFCYLCVDGPVEHSSGQIFLYLHHDNF
jgi:hypothetical protein